MRVYIDSDILIWHLRGENKALHFLKILEKDAGHELWTGVMQRAEITSFMRPQEEEKTLLFLAQFKTAPLDQAAIDLASSLYRKWNSTAGVDINDAILAATVIHTGGKIFCLNKKHYPMPEIIVEKPW